MNHQSSTEFVNNCTFYFHNYRNITSIRISIVSTHSYNSLHAWKATNLIFLRSHAYRNTTSTALGLDVLIIQDIHTHTQTRSYSSIQWKCVCVILLCVHNNYNARKKDDQSHWRGHCSMRMKKMSNSLFRFHQP